MARYLQKALAGAGKAVADIGIMNMKADILAERDAKLEEYRSNAAIQSQNFQAGQDIRKEVFQTSERIAGEAATSARDTARFGQETKEGGLDRGNRLDVAAIKDRARGMNIKFGDGQWVDANSGKVVAVPSSPKQVIEQAAAMAMVEFKEQKGPSSKRKSLTQLFDDWEVSLAKKHGIDMSGKVTPPPSPAAGSIGAESIEDLEARLKELKAAKK